MCSFNLKYNSASCWFNSDLKYVQSRYQTFQTVCWRKWRWHRTSWMIFCSSLFSLSSWRDFSSSLLFVDEPVFMVSCWSDCHSPRVISLRIYTKTHTTLGITTVQINVDRILMYCKLHNTVLSTICYLLKIECEPMSSRQQ